MSLWGGLFFTCDSQIQIISIFGDSKLIIGWVTNNYQMMSPFLQGWMDRVRKLWRRLGCPVISHVFRENNTRADRLSKRGLLAYFGSMKIEHFRNGVLVEVSSAPIP